MYVLRTFLNGLFPNQTNPNEIQQIRFSVVREKSVQISAFCVICARLIRMREKIGKNRLALNDA